MAPFLTDLRMDNAHLANIASWSSFKIGSEYLRSGQLNSFAIKCPKIGNNLAAFAAVDGVQNWIIRAATSPQRFSNQQVRHRSCFTCLNAAICETVSNFLETVPIQRSQGFACHDPVIEIGESANPCVDSG